MITENAYAKINLTLEVTSKRSDGYHNIRSIMQSISLHDTVTAETASDGISLYCDAPEIPTDISNTAYKAAKLFLDEAKLSSGVSVTLEKHIPSRAGLGGGSADAAAVLRAMQALFGAPLHPAQLQEIAARVGADVPFCLYGGTALARGIGEKLSPLPSLPKCHIVTAFAGGGLSTREMYTLLDARGISEKPDHSSFTESALASGDIFAVCRSLYNCFGDVASEHAPEISALKSALISNGADGSLMSGSGSAVFGIFTDPINAKRCADVLRGNGVFSHVSSPEQRYLPFPDEFTGK